MKKAFFFLLIMSSLANAQVRQIGASPEKFLGNFYRNSPLKIRLQYPAGSVDKVSTIYYRGQGLAKWPLQPKQIDSTSEGVTLYWPSAKQLPDAGWLEVSLNGSVYAAGTISVDYRTSSVRSDTLRFAPLASPPTLLFNGPPQAITAQYVWNQLMSLLFN